MQLNRTQLEYYFGDPVNRYANADEFSKWTNERNEAGLNAIMPYIIDDSLKKVGKLTDLKRQ